MTGAVLRGPISTRSSGLADSGGGSAEVFAFTILAALASSTLARAVSVPKRAVSVLGSFMDSGIFATIALTSSFSRAFRSRRRSVVFGFSVAATFGVFVPSGSPDGIRRLSLDAG